jgi:hypothetical protein
MVVRECFVHDSQGIVHTAKRKCYGNCLGYIPSAKARNSMGTIHISAHSEIAIYGLEFVINLLNSSLVLCVSLYLFDMVQESF